MNVTYLLFFFSCYRNISCGLRDDEDLGRGCLDCKAIKNVLKAVKLDVASSL